MTSNFLGDTSEFRSASSILSASELIAREGVSLQKGMNWREEGVMLPVFLVLPRETGYRDEWREQDGVYVYEGHDSTTVEGGESVDQLLLYPSGRLTDNGKFYKAAQAFKDGVRSEPLGVQVYEKLDAGVWFDKGIFNLVDALGVEENGRKVFKFHLTPAGFSNDAYGRERMLPAGNKAEMWTRDHGRCATCGSESGLCFGEDIRLHCELHGGRVSRDFL